MRKRIKKTKPNTVFLFSRPNRLFLIPTVLLRKTLTIVLKKIGITAWGVSAKVF